MTTLGTCPRERDNVAQQWTSGRLDPEPAAAFEEHLLECPGCKKAVEDVVALRAALARSRARRRTLRIVISVLPLGAAAAIAFFWFGRADPLAHLARLDLPEFTGEVVRSAAPDAAAAADRGLAQYRAGDYARAARSFTEASRTSPSPSVDFFLAASLLAAGRPTDAVAPFRRVLGATPNVYEDEARLYLAKTYLRLQHADSALTVLSVPNENDGPTALHARALIDSIRRVIRR